MSADSLRILFIIASFCLPAITTFGQQSIKWSEDQLLTWSDFTGNVVDSSKFDAECFAEINYTYKFYNHKNFEFEVYAVFDKNTSWSRKEKQSDDLLRHEQMHFNIAQLYAEKLKKEFNSYSYTAGYNTQILEVFNQKKLEYQALQLRYDEETNHSLNKVKQKEWEEFIENELRNIRFSLQLVQNEKKDIETVE